MPRCFLPSEARKSAVTFYCVLIKHFRFVRLWRGLGKKVKTKKGTKEKLRNTLSHTPLPTRTHALFLSSLTSLSHIHTQAHTHTQTRTFPLYLPLIHTHIYPLEHKNSLTHSHTLTTLAPPFHASRLLKTRWPFLFLFLHLIKIFFFFSFHSFDLCDILLYSECSVSFTFSVFSFFFSTYLTKSFNTRPIYLLSTQRLAISVLFSESEKYGKQKGKSSVCSSLLDVSAVICLSLCCICIR